MARSREEAVAEVAALHSAEEWEKSIAAELPAGLARDAHVMLGERLSDRAWSIEEAMDLDAYPSGLWKN